jgi:hypothetical protein
LESSPTKDLNEILDGAVSQLGSAMLKKIAVPEKPIKRVTFAFLTSYRQAGIITNNDPDNYENLLIYLQEESIHFNFLSLLRDLNLLLGFRPIWE